MVYLYTHLIIIPELHNKTYQTTTQNVGVKILLMLCKNGSNHTPIVFDITAHFDAEKTRLIYDKIDWSV